MGLSQSSPDPSSGLGNENASVSLVGWLGALSGIDRVASLVGLGALALVAAVIWLLLQVLRQQGRMLVRLETIEGRLMGGSPGAVSSIRTSAGLLVGSRAPTFSLKALDGAVVTLETLTALGKPVVALFTNPHCGPCEGALARRLRPLATSIRRITGRLRPCERRVGAR